MIGKRLGHTRVQTTARYAQLARETAMASAARIGDSIDNDLVAAPKGTRTSAVQSAWTRSQPRHTFGP